MEIVNNETWKYNLQILDPTSDEFKFVQHFFKTTSNKFSYFKEAPETLENFQIWKVIEQNINVTVHEKSDNLMLFHGTSQKGVAGILENGFKNSEKGKFGKGVYLTECSGTASRYSSLKLFRKNFYFIFVNELLNSENLQTLVYERLFNLIPYVPNEQISSFSKYIDYLSKIFYTPLKNPFTKYMYYLSPEISEENYKEDFKGRRYRNIAVDKNSCQDEFVADSKLVIPRYLITYENKVMPTLKFLIFNFKIVIFLVLVVLLIKYFIKKVFLLIKYFIKKVFSQLLVNSCLSY